LSGEGIFGEGMMFANQAAASAILVVTLHRAGTGSERVVDALIGGGVALVLGVGLFPAHPLRLLEDAERALLRALAAPLREAARLIGIAQAPPTDWALRTGQQIHQLLGGLARTRATAHANVRVAPRRWRLRTTVDAEIERTEPLDLLANAVLSLVRATASRDVPRPTLLERDISALAESITVLAEAPRPWSGGTLEGVRRQARGAREVAECALAETPVVAAIVRAIATDLEAVARTPAGVTSPPRAPPAPRHAMK
jgi:hypothetical protein